MITVPLLDEHGSRRTAIREVAKSTEKTTRFIAETLDFLVNAFENSLRVYYFNWLNSCLLARGVPASSVEYAPRHPEESVLYRVVAAQLETFLARQQERDHPLPGFVEREFRSLGSATI